MNFGWTISSPHTCDLDDATNLSPSDVGSIITKGFQEPEDIRISHENNVGLATPRSNRLHGLMIKNTMSRGIYMNKFYCNSWDAYEDHVEDSSRWSWTGIKGPVSYRRL